MKGISSFRLKGDAGIQILNTCPPDYLCGGHVGLWTDAEMPSAVGEVRQVALYGSWNSKCKWYVVHYAVV